LRGAAFSVTSLVSLGSQRVYIVAKWSSGDRAGGSEGYGDG
jgi:hypothetical protein